MATNLTVRYSGDSRYGYWNGRFDLGENFEMEGDRILYIGYGNGSFGVVRQRGGFIAPNGSQSSYLGGDHGVAAYFLEGGTYFGSRDYFYPKGDYVHFRQTGGVFTNARFQVGGEATTSVRKDFVFGGGTATLTGRTSMSGEMLFAFTDSADFRGRHGDGGGMIAWNMYYATNSIWAYNGGVADFMYYYTYRSKTGDQYSSPTNAFHAFNGGARGLSTAAYTTTFGYSPKVRVYEKGGEIRASKIIADAPTGEISEPEGNVLQSIAMSDELRNRVWPAPPSVHVMDATGYGAAAVVDYDFDTGRVTNITVMSKGENFTAPTANLRYRQGEALLSENLVCEIGPEPPASNFTYSAKNPGARLQPFAFTNHLACTMTVDMDMDGIADHGKTNILGNVLGLRYGYGGTEAKWNYFPNCTNIVLKSGELRSSYLYDTATSYQWGFRHDNMLPKCHRIELYGGHLTGGTARFTDIVIGGEVWLYSNKGTSWYADLQTTFGDNDSCPTNGCLTIDAARGTNGTCTSVLKGGKVNFIKSESGNSTVTVKNWKSIPTRRSYTVLLDLSETEVNGNANVTRCVPDIVYPEDAEGGLFMRWEMDPETGTKPYKLLARRLSNGTMILFR